MKITWDGPSSPLQIRVPRMPPFHCASSPGLPVVLSRPIILMVAWFQQAADLRLQMGCGVVTTRTVGRRTLHNPALSSNLVGRFPLRI